MINKSVTTHTAQQPISSLLKGLGTLAMFIILGAQLNISHWFGPAATTHTQVSETALLFALLSLIFLCMSLFKPLLGYIYKQTKNLSIEQISSIYFAGGCVFFCVSLLI